MTCEQAELRMAELLAGEIAAEDRAALEKHLLDCAGCRGDFEVARAGARIEWADVSVPKEVIEATLASFREPAPVVRLLRWATAAAAVFGLAALLITSSRTTPKAEEAVVAACAAERPQMLATMQDAAVGAMVCKDEDGRPVGELGLKSHEVTVEILDGIAKTTVEENFENHTGRRLEGTFNFPLPADASISRLALEVNGKIEEGTCLERERAREVFEGIVRRMQDPALLEWQPGGFFKCRVFPIEPRSTKRVIVAYTQALPCFQGKMSYVYPLASEKTRTHAPEEVRISVQARFSGALAKIESPSHHLEVQRRNANEASMSFRAAHYRPNNDFVVTMEPGPEEVRVVSHKSDGEDGYFACFATPQGGGERKPAKVAFVLDASASTSAPRLDVAKRLVRAMMERRIEGDRFEILAHHIDVDRSGEVDLRAANTFMDRLQPIGGSDVLQALRAAGDAEVIYIGKGAPTFGEMETSKILDAVKGRRIRTIAVGSDANVALLERLGGMMRVSPNDDVAKRVAEIAATLGAPVLSDVKLEGGDAVYDVVGVRDLFYGERLVVSGRYRGPASKVVITGRGYRREVDVAFPVKEEGNNYVRRLWAQRKVADLLAKGPATKAEVTDLGVKYQIMTPYTSFLVLETEQMWKDHQLKREVQKQDEVLGKLLEEEKKRNAEAEAQAHDLPTRREVLRKVAHLLELSYMAADQKKFDRCIKLCDEILLIDPNYTVARELKEDAEKSRHKEEYYSVVSRKVDQWKRLTDDKDQPVIPYSQTLRVPSREAWADVSKRLTESVIKTEGRAAETEKLEGQDGARLHGLLDQGTTLYKSGKYAEASTKFEEAFAMRPSSDQVYAFIQRAGVETVGRLMNDPDRRVQDTGRRLFELAKPPEFLREGKSPEPPTPAPVLSATPRTADPTPPPPPVVKPPPTPESVERLAEDTSTQSLVIRTTPRTGEYDKFMQEALVRTRSGPTMLDNSRSLQGQQGWSNEAVGTTDRFSHRPFNGPTFLNDNDWTGYLALPTEGGAVPDIFSITTNVAAPGAPITDPLPVLGDIPVIGMMGGGKQNLPRKFWMDNGELPKIEADMQVFVRQQEVQLAQIQELTTKVEETRAKLSKSLNEKSLAVTELQYARQMSERLQQDLAQLEEKYVEMARDKKHLEEKMNGIAQAGANLNVAPKKALEAKVTAIANEIGLLVFSIGKDDGVLEGDEFTVYRGGDFVAKVVVDRADRKWAAGKIVLKKSDPRIADDVSNHIFVGSPVACTVPSLSMDVVAASEDGSRISLSSKAKGAAPKQCFAVTRNGRFVALVRIGRVADSEVEASVLQNLAVGRVLPGDRAVYVPDPKLYLASLPQEVRMDLSSRASQQAMRAKMELTK